jgi:Tfp pilus assembly protein PilX
MARRARLRGERGIALPFVLVTMLGTGTLASSAIAYSSWNYGSTKRSDAENQAFALAEAGLNYAYSTLYNSSTPTMANAVPSRTIQLETGEASYYGTLDGSTWTLVGVGTVRNPTGPGSQPVVRTVKGRATVGSARRGTDNNAVWNYVYVDDPTFTTNLGNSVNINIPLYTQGNLRLSNSAQVSAYALQVKGWVELNNSSHIGEAGAPVHEVHVAGGCRVGPSGTLTKPCGPGQNVHATISDSTPTNFSKPPVDLNGWYYNAKPGPRQPCTVGSFPGGFDNDATPNNSRPAVDLLPNSSYDCRVYDASGALVGQLTWNVTTKVLTMHGTIYFDGPIQFRNSNFAVYAGRATIYSSGNISFANSTTLCGDPQCDADWNPQQNLLAFVAGGNVTVANSTKFQGATYAVYDYTEENNSTVWGPVIARRVAFANSSINHYVPIGTLMPGMPASYEDVVTITNESGSWG